MLWLLFLSLLLLLVMMMTTIAIYSFYIIIVGNIIIIVVIIITIIRSNCARNGRHFRSWLRGKDVSIYLRGIGVYSVTRRVEEGGILRWYWALYIKVSNIGNSRL